MRWQDIHVTAVATELGEEIDTAAAVADGRYPADEHEASGYLGVRVVDKGPAIDLAVRAATCAVERAGLTGDQVGLVTHSSIGHQGLDDFAAASYVQNRTVGGGATAMEIRQASNGGMAALDMAACFLTARPACSAALLTTSDRFVPPMFDRFRTAKGLLLGDGGTAMVLSRTPGVARVLSTVVVGDSRFNDMQIGDDPWCEAPGGNGWPVSTQARVEAFIASRGPDIVEDMVRSIGGTENALMKEALIEAGLEAGDIRWWVFPNMGALTDWYSFEEFGFDESGTTWGWGRRAGHLGAGDQFASLAFLFETRRVRVGDRVMISGAGTGFTFASAVLEITAEPDWSPTAITGMIEC